MQWKIYLSNPTHRLFYIYLNENQNKSSKINVTSYLDILNLISKNIKLKSTKTVLANTREAYF